MPARAKIQRTFLQTVAIIAGTVVVGLAVLILARMIVHSSRAEAASVIYYPNFCLGGWKYPQHASGPAAVSTAKFEGLAFTADNSAYLESSIASQLFCGYFSVRNAKNPPKKAMISFNWNVAFLENGDQATSTDESYTSPEGYITVPAAGIMVAASSTTATSTFPMNPPTGSLPASSQNIPEASSSTPGGQDTPVSVDNIDAINSSQISLPTQNPSAETSNSSTDQPVQTPEPTEPTSSSVPASSPTPDAPQSFNIPVNISGSIGQSFSSFITSLIVERVQAAEPTDVETIVHSPLNTSAFKDFLEVSYSLDGIRWTAIGRVNKDNWNGYKVEIPVISWDEVKRLQIMISVLPTIDQKPDIYLDSMSMRAEYDQTVAELAAQGLAAVSNAVDSLIGDGNGAIDAMDIIPEEKKGSQLIEVRKKKLSFSLGGTPIHVVDDGDEDQNSTTESNKKSKVRPEGRTDGEVNKKAVQAVPNGDGSSVVISGSCRKKYFVVLTYRRETDYIKRASSSVINEAHECIGGSFSYDMTSLSPDTTRDGQQYLLIGEQDEIGPWTPISDIYPISIHASTTVEIIYQ